MLRLRRSNHLLSASHADMWKSIRSLGRIHLMALAACLWCATTASVRSRGPTGEASWEWTTASPESQGMDPAALESAWAALKDRQTTALLVIRHDRIVFERYAPGFGRTSPTAPHRWPRHSWAGSA